MLPKRTAGSSVRPALDTPHEAALAPVDSQAPKGQEEETGAKEPAHGMPAHGKARPQEHEAQEEEEEQLVTAKPVLRKPPEAPSAAERREHEDTGHVVYRSWCKVCNETRGTGFIHRTVAKSPEEKAAEVPVVGFDYCYMNEDGSECLPILVMKDHVYLYWGATVVEVKGPSDYAVSYMVGYLRDLGFRRVFLKCDNEPAILSLRDKVRESMRDVEIMYTGPPPGDHPS